MVASLSRAPFRLAPDVAQRRVLQLSIATAIAAGLLAAPAVDARLTKFEVTVKESPTFGGMTFGTVGAYEKITARAFGEVDPSLPANALITDIHSLGLPAAQREPRRCPQGRCAGPDTRRGCR